MNSPVKNKKEMSLITLEDGLTAYQCLETEGVFLPVASYIEWLSKQPERLPQLPVDQSSEEAVFEGSSEVKICPESGYIMQRYCVGHGFNFYVDRSPNGSLWFDKGEWQALRERQFHDEIHLIFTAPWQSKVRSEQKAQAEQALLLERLGESLLTKMEELHELLQEHEYRDLAIAYLNR